MAENRNFDLNSNFQFSEIPLKKRKDSRLCNSTPSSSCTEGSSSGNPLKKRYFEPLFSYSEGSTSSHGSSAKERVYLGLSTDEEENNVCVNPSAIHAENRIPLLQAIDDKISYLKEEVENMKPETLWKPDKHAIDDKISYLKEEVENMKPETLWKPDKHAIDDKISYLKEEVENMKPETLWKPDKDSLNYFSALTNTFMAPDLNSEQKEFALNVSKSNDTGCSEIEDLSCKINVLDYSQSSENFVEPTSTAFPQLPLTHNNLNTSTDNSYHSHTMSLTGDGGFLPEERYNMNSDYAAKFALNIPSSKTGLRILSPVSEKYKELVSYGKQHVCDKTELIQTTSNPSEELTNNRCPSTQVSNFLANPLQMFYAPVAERITVDDALDVLDSVSPKLRSSPLQESDHHSHRVTPSISDDAIKQDAYTFSNDLKHLNQASTSGLQIENDMFNKANSSEDDSDYDDSIPLKSFVKWLSTENKNKKNGDTNLHLNLMNPDSHLHEREVRLNKDTEVQETLENNQRNRDKQLVQYKDSEIDNKMGSTSKHNTVVINETSIKSNLPVSDSLYLKIQRKYAEIENLSNSNKPQHKGLDLNVPLKNLLPLPNVTETLQKKGLFFKDVSTHNYMLESKLTLKDDDENKRLIRSCLPENTKPDISKAFKSHFSEFEDIDGLYNVNQLQHHQNSDVKDQRLSNYKSLLCNKPTSFGYNKKPKKYFPNLSEDCAEGNKSGKQIPEKKTTEEFRSKLREFIKNSEFRPRQYMDSYIPEIPPEEAPTQETSWDLSVNLSLKSHTLPDTLDKSNRFFPKSYNEKSKPNIIDLSSGCDENGDADDDCSSDGVEVVEIVRRDKKSQNRSKQYFTVLDDDCTVLDPPKPFRRSGSLRCIDGMDSAKPSTSRALSPYTYFPLDMSNPLTSKKKSLFGASTSSSTSSEKEDADVIWDPVLPNSNEADYLSTSPESVIMCSSPESCPSPTKSAERSIEDEIIGSLQKAFENPPKRKRSGTSKNVPVLTIPEDECSSDESKSKVAKVVEEGKRQDFRSELECAICLENMSSKRGTSATTCGHVYCTPCITEVIEKKKMCPTCRNSLDPSQVHKLFLFG